MPYLIRYTAVLLLLLLSGNYTVLAQLGNGAQQQQNMFEQGRTDSSALKKPEKWKEATTKIHYTIFDAQVKHAIDTTIDKFHRFQPSQPWWMRDLGNYGTAAINQFFSPDYKPGLSLGFHVYDKYKINIDSLRYYNTTRPYSEFSFMLGSKNQQNASLLHTQNITPRWNFAADLRNFNSPGFFRLQGVNNIMGSLNTKYKSKNEKYKLYAAVVYNTITQNENGGVTDITQLEDPNFAERSLIAVNIPGVNNNSTRNSVVTNKHRDAHLLVQQSYAIGLTDTIYNNDSTGYHINFTPRFSLKHQLQISSERHIFRDLNPQTARYLPIDSIAFSLRDTLLSQHNWTFVDNKFSLNGFLGKSGQQVQIEAGIANRLDWQSNYFRTDNIKLSSISNYLFANVKKEATAAKQWGYEGQAAFFFTGDALGNFNLQASASKDLGKWGLFSAQVQQVLSNAPFSYTTFYTNYYQRNYQLDKISNTRLGAHVLFPDIHLSFGVRNNLLANYIYFNSNLEVTQQSEAFSVLQAFGSKEFKFGLFSLDNEVVWQQATVNAPVNIPAFLFRHKLGIQTQMFKSALLVATGLELRYNTPYFADGYTPYFNQFYYQNDIKITNYPEVLVYANFKIKHFRAFVMMDQLQQLISTNVLFAPGYPGPNAIFRFGFNWPLIN